jgi:hypothetical protein
MAMSDKSKFRFPETFNNSDGKTSGSGMVGVLMGLTTVLCFIAGTIGLFFGIEGIMELVDASLQLGLLSGALLGLRKATGIFGSGRNANLNRANDVLKEEGEKDKDPIV